MPMSPEKVGMVVQKGLSVVCATCERYWEGRDRGMPEPQCSTSKPCGSPLAGLEFPAYKGPITSFKDLCFVCGGAPRLGIGLPGSAKVFALCEDHMGLVEALQPTGVGRAVDPNVRYGEVSTRRVEQKSLLGAIAEVEAYYASKNG